MILIARGLMLASPYRSMHAKAPTPDFIGQPNQKASEDQGIFTGVFCGRMWPRQILLWRCGTRGKKYCLPEPDKDRGSTGSRGGTPCATPQAIQKDKISTVNR